MCFHSQRPRKPILQVIDRGPPTPPTAGRSLLHVPCLRLGFRNAPVLGPGAAMSLQGF